MKSLDILWPGEGDADKKWLLGVSGGLDSMVLLHAAHEAGLREVVICHLNHGLRGEEADGDEEFVRAAAEACGYAFEVRRVELRALMAASGESLETAGRRARHEFYADCMRKHGCDEVVLGHHADDQAETVLWNLMRGSFGCRGMQKRLEMKVSGQSFLIFRPLLSVRKVELQAWLEERGYTWREDASNQVNDVVRNRLRNEVLPLLDEIAKRDVTPMIARAAAADAASREVMAWALKQANVYDPQGRLHLGVLRGLPEALQSEAIRDLLKHSGIHEIHQAMMERCLGILDVSAAASTNLVGRYRLRRKSGRLFVDKT